MVLGRRRIRNNEDRLWRDVSRKHGFFAAVRAVLFLKLIKLAIYAFFAALIIGAVGIYIVLSG